VDVILLDIAIFFEDVRFLLAIFICLMPDKIMWLWNTQEAKKLM
jgi:hypothetical protein